MLVIDADIYPYPNDKHVAKVTPGDTLERSAAVWHAEPRVTQSIARYVLKTRPGGDSLFYLFSREFNLVHADITGSEQSGWRFRSVGGKDNVKAALQEAEDGCTGNRSTPEERDYYVRHPAEFKRMSAWSEWALPGWARRNYANEWMPHHASFFDRFPPPSDMRSIGERPPPSHVPSSSQPPSGPSYTRHTQSYYYTGASDRRLAIQTTPGWWQTIKYYPPRIVNQAVSSGRLQPVQTRGLRWRYHENNRSYIHLEFKPSTQTDVLNACTLIDRTLR
ncbi:hypothetical protein JCM10207_002551 [Rhodosporidiobolus poonsookiae]